MSRNGSLNGPLQRVIGRRTVLGRGVDVLECGHLFHLPEYPTHTGYSAAPFAKSRRCVKCRGNKPADVPPEESEGEYEEGGGQEDG